MQGKWQGWEARNPGVTLGPVCLGLRVHTTTSAGCSTPTYLTCQPYLRNIFETELAHTGEEFRHHDSSRLTHRYARHPTRTIFASISRGTSGSWWPWGPRGSSLSLVPLNQQQKKSSEICFRGINRAKRHRFTQKECKMGWKKQP